MVNVCKHLHSDPPSVMSGQGAKWLLGLQTTGGVEPADVTYTITDPTIDAWFDTPSGRLKAISNKFPNVDATCNIFSTPYVLVGTYQGIVQVDAVVVSTDGSTDSSIGGVQFN